MSNSQQLQAQTTLAIKGLVSLKQKGQNAIPELKKILEKQSEGDPWEERNLRNLVVECLIKMNSRGAIMGLAQLILDDSLFADMREELAKAFGRLKVNEKIPELLAISQKLLIDSQEIFKNLILNGIIEAITSMITRDSLNNYFKLEQNQRILELLEKKWREDSKKQISQKKERPFIGKMSEIEKEKAVERLLDYFCNKREWIDNRVNAVRDLGKIKFFPVIPKLRQILREETLDDDPDDNAKLRAELAIVLCEMPAPDALAEVFMILQDKSIQWDAKTRMFLFLCEFGDQAVKKDLLSRLAKQHLGDWVRWNIGDAFSKSKILNRSDISALLKIFDKEKKYTHKYQKRIKRLIARMLFEIGKREKISVV